MLHTALRNHGAEAVIVDGEDVMPSVRTVVAHMRAFSEAAALRGTPVQELAAVATLDGLSG